MIALNHFFSYYIKAVGIYIAKIGDLAYPQQETEFQPPNTQPGLYVCEGEKAMPRKEIWIKGLQGIPEVRPGDDLAQLIVASARSAGIDLCPGDIVVIAQKVVSKSEGRLVDPKEIEPSAFALHIAKESGKDPHFVEVVLREARRLIRMDRGILIAETRHGFVCANAGVDTSNVPGGLLCLLPLDPDASANIVRQRILDLTGNEVAVVISDTFGRPWRLGHVNVAIGVAGLKPLLDYRGVKDSFGYVLKVTEMAIADELAAAAELVTGKVDRVPVALIRGYQFHPGQGKAVDLIRKPEEDLFR